MYYVFKYTNRSTRVSEFFTNDNIEDIKNCLRLPVNKQQLRTLRSITKIEVQDGSTGAVVAYYKCKALPEPGTHDDDRYYFIEIWADERFDIKDCNAVLNAECNPVNISWDEACAEIRWVNTRIAREQAQEKYLDAKEKYESILRDEETLREAFEETLND
jgi:hypothetical protein